MYCRNCGTRNDDTAHSCIKCGERLPNRRERRYDSVGTPDWVQLVGDFADSNGTERDTAFEALYNASHKSIYAYIRSYAGSADSYTDAVQNAYMTCWTKIDQLDDANKFLPWMKRIARNAYLDSVRKKSGQTAFGTISDNDGNDTDAEELLEDDTLLLPEDAVANKELHQLLLQSIDELSDAQRVVMKGFYFENIPVQELASELGVPANTIKTHLSRGRKNLARKVSSYANAYGLKLVPIAIVPFMTLLSKEDAYACELAAATTGSATVLSAIQQTLGVSTQTASTAATTASSASVVSTTAGSGGAASTVTSAAGSSFAVKAGAGILATAVAIGGASTYLHHKNAAVEEPTIAESAVTISTESAEPEVPQLSEEERIRMMMERAESEYGLVDNGDLTSPYYQYVPYAHKPDSDEVYPRDRYAVATGNYSGAEGIYAAFTEDMDLDGDLELVVLSRSLEEHPSMRTNIINETWNKWEFVLSIFDIDNNAVIVQNATICTIDEVHDISVPFDGYGLIIYMKSIDSTKEIIVHHYDYLYPSYEFNTVEVARLDAKIAGNNNILAYQYNDYEIQSVAKTWCLSERTFSFDPDLDTEFYDALDAMGLSISANNFNPECITSLHDHNTPGNAAYYVDIISDDEPDIEKICEVFTTTNIDMNTWHDYELRGATAEFDPSPYTSTLKTIVYNSDNIVYAVE